MNFVLIIALFLIISIIITFLLKKFFHTDSWLIISLVKTKKPLKIMEKLSKHWVWNFIAELGLILGFGTLAFDYLKTREKNLKQRIMLNLIVTILLMLVFIGIDFALNGFVSRNPQAKNFYWLITIVFGLTGFSGFALASLIISGANILINYFIGVKSCPGVAPLIPGVEIPGVPITPPLHAWISLIIILIIHEGAHGITAFANKIKLKSSGVLLLGFLPIGAFVEPDEEKFKQTSKKQPKKALRMLAAGPTANLIALPIIFIFILISGLVISSVFTPWAMPIKKQMILGVQINEVKEYTNYCGKKINNPAFGKLEKGDKIIKINDEKINSTTELKLALMKTNKAKFLIERNKKEINIELKPNELGAYGIILKDIKNPNYTPPKEFLLFSTALNFFLEFFNWLFILNLLIAIVNFLPFAIFDGGRIAQIILLPYFKFLNKTEEETSKLIQKILTNLILLILLINALPLIF